MLEAETVATGANTAQALSSIAQAYGRFGINQILLRQEMVSCNQWVFKEARQYYTRKQKPHHINLLLGEKDFVIRMRCFWGFIFSCSFMLPKICTVLLCFSTVLIFMDGLCNKGLGYTNCAIQLGYKIAFGCHWVIVLSMGYCLYIQ